jgi:hypothetical protein
MNVRLWFVQLAGWPVVLTILALGVVSMVGLSILMARLADRSVVQNAVLALVVLAFGSLAVLVALSFFTRA